MGNNVFGNTVFYTTEEIDVQVALAIGGFRESLDPEELRRVDIVLAREDQGIPFTRFLLAAGYEYVDFFRKDENGMSTWKAYFDHWGCETAEKLLSYLAGFGVGYVAEFETDDGDFEMTNTMGSTDMVSDSLVPIPSMRLGRLEEKEIRLDKISKLVEADSPQTELLLRVREILTEAVRV